MATNLESDNDLINGALELSKHKTKRNIVEEALEEYVQRRKQQNIVKLFGTINESGLLMINFGRHDHANK